MIYTIPFSLNDGTEKGPESIVQEVKKLLTQAQANDLRIKTVPIDLNQIQQVLTDTKERALILGGSHIITLHTVKAFVQQHPGAGVVFLDAHPDALRSYAGQQDVIRGIVTEKLIPSEKIILIGLRHIQPEEQEFFQMYPGIKAYTMDRIFDLGLQEVCDLIMEQIRQWPSFYLSIDMDVIDPAFAPGVTEPVPGGLQSRELLYLVKRFCMLRNRGWSDICEVNPTKDMNAITIKLAAKVAQYLI